jgi:hypothetical protein
MYKSIKKAVMKNAESIVAQTVMIIDKCTEVYFPLKLYSIPVSSVA